MARGADGSMLTKEQLDQLNLDRYNQAIADGNLYNIGPIVDGGGTSFSPERWDDYFDKNPTVKPKNYTNQKDIQAKLDSGETIDTDSQEFVVERDDVEVISEEDMTPSYPKRGKDNSFLTEAQAQSELSKEVEADIKTQAPVEAEKDVDDEFDSPVSEWIKEFSSMEDEEFNSVKMAIEQLPANAQEAYATVAATKDDIQFEDALAKGSKANQDKIDAITDQAPTEEEMNQKYTDTKDRALGEVDKMIIEQDYQDEIKSIDDFYDGTTEKKGMLTSNTKELGKGPGEAEADNLARDQAGDMEISDMKGKDREITTTIMKDTGLDMDQANALMGKLKGLCG
jgi:hypothetical protein